MDNIWYLGVNIFYLLSVYTDFMNSFHVFLQLLIILHCSTTIRTKERFLINVRYLQKFSTFS